MTEMTCIHGKSLKEPCDLCRPLDMVNHPPHYKKGRFETIDVIVDIVQFYPGALAHSAGAALKYIARAPHKGALLKDLKKARWYLDHLIKLVEGNTK